MCVCVWGGGGGGGGEWEEGRLVGGVGSVCMCGGGRRVDGRSNMPYRNVIVGVLVDQRSVE